MHRSSDADAGTITADRGRSARGSSVKIGGATGANSGSTRDISCARHDEQRPNKRGADGSDHKEVAMTRRLSAALAARKMFSIQEVVGTSTD